MKEDKRDENTSISILIMMVETFIIWRKFIFWCVIGSIVLSTVIAFLIPPKFKSTTSVFPSEKADLFSTFSAVEGVSSLIESYSSARGLASLGQNTELEKYLAILKSGNVLSEMIKKFDLITVYDITKYPMENTTKELLENIDINIADEGNLTISVYDKDPQRASDMANFFLEALNRVNSDIQLQNARDNLQFIEVRYKKNAIDLATAEESLKVFQKRYGVISLSSQIDAAIKAGAGLTGSLVLKEIELEVLKKSLLADNALIKSKKIEIDEMKKKISQLNVNKHVLYGDINLIVPFKKIPDLGTEYVRKYREVEIQNKIMQFLTPIYEQAKVEIQRKSSSVVILDKAFPSERKSKPQRIIIILVGFTVGLFCSLTFVALANRWSFEKKNNTLLYLAILNLGNIINFKNFFRKH